MYITAADSTGGNAHQNLLGPGHWCRKIGDIQLVVLREKKSFHVGRVHGW
jgi:hypothetical protein